MTSVTRSERPDPDRLLAELHASAEQESRGRLKVFLGYAAGVGKTYAMLESAHVRLRGGTDVVIGYIETHQRAATEALVQGFEVVPRQVVDYRGVQVTEMDLDAVLARKPRLVLVDELAHTNAPGMRHARRYQDVREILDAGIDVYTTLNVQHLESLNDVVAQITGIQVRETLPDLVIDASTDIEVIDLPPEELIRRLEEGKIYIPEQAERAMRKFFRRGNLNALRELMMRRAAERVDDQMRAYMATQDIEGPWPAGEGLLVCIGPGALSERLVRTTRRLADELKARWYAVYVETPQNAQLTDRYLGRVTQLLQLAEELGAHAVSLPGSSVAETVVDYARKHNVTKIITGKPLRSRWVEFLRPSVADELIHTSGPIDVYVVSSDQEGDFKILEAWRPHQPWDRYLKSLVVVAAATGLNLLISPFISPTNLVMVYLLAIVLIAIYLGRGPAVFASILGVLTFDFMFVPPHYTFAVSDTEYFLTFGGLLGVGLVISHLASRAREQAEVAKRHERQAVELYDLSRDLTIHTRINSVATTVIAHLNRTFGKEAALFLPDSEGKLKAFASSPGLTLNEADLAIAAWAYDRGKSAGPGTETLPDSELRYQPLRTHLRTVGVLGIKTGLTNGRLSPDQRRNLEGIANQAALAIERIRLADQANQAQVLEISDKLQSALLNSISHDLRSPLVTITGVLSSLRTDSLDLETEDKKNLVETAYKEAERLNMLVSNLLDMTRLESGSVQLHKEDCDLEDVISSTLQQLEERLADHPVITHIPEDLPLIPMDFVMVARVFFNLVDNAIKYSPPGLPIEINVQITTGHVEATVADRGEGIPKEDLARIFEKFYRVQRPEHITGTGLGLSICKGIVEAHGGFIAAENRPGGGTIVTVGLPLKG